MTRHTFDTPRPYWTLKTPLRETAPTEGELRGREKTDVGIVGGGITGLLSGLLLLRSGRAVSILERNAPLSGETSRSTAHISEVLDSRFDTLMDRFGLDHVLLYSESHRMAIHRLGALIEEIEGLGACGWSRLPGYLFCENTYQEETLRKEWSALDALHISSSLVKHVPLPFSVLHAVRVENQAQVNPEDLQRLLLNTFIKEGGRFYDYSPVESVTPIPRGVRITTQGGTLACDQCIISTHSPILMPSVTHFETKPLRTYVLATRLKTAPLMDGLFWDMDSPYHYFRMANDVLLVGGEDHRTGLPNGKTSSSVTRLEDYTRSRFIVDSLITAWSGQILESVDGLPLVGSSLRSDRIFYATGFGGNGISQGALSAILLQDLLEGKRDALAKLLSPHRLNRPKDIRSFLSNNWVFPKNMSTSLVKKVAGNRFRPKGEFSPSELAPDEARVAHSEETRIASYCDSQGSPHTVSARCTHLGGEVCFNDFEKTWDCPCHGSRFNLDGSVLCGPAKKPLKTVEMKKPKKRAA